MTASWDHPRLCGEKCEMPSTAFLYLGSPPPMRGKARNTARFHRKTRITPAYAGKSKEFLKRMDEYGDHPRLCGEKLLSAVTSATTRGSPPPMRGKVFLSTSRAFCNQDHPRLCGEKVFLPLVKTSQKGSPPPMRGKVFCNSSIAFVKRITPAYAGKSSWQPHRYSRQKDHPRLCGEKAAAGIKNNIPLGSPPPMRGKADDGSTGNPKGRITPAYAGKRGRARKQIHQLRDHPRLCGEKQFCYFFVNLTPGSPPPMRGKD